MAKFLREPPTVRGAVATIVVATATVVVVGGVLIRVLDREEYSSVWVGMWWAIQTVTTVGYGDVAPKDVGGRLVATVVMLEGTAFIAIVTAVITSSFVTRAQTERDATQRSDDLSDREAMERRFDELERKIDALAAQR